MCSPVLQVLLEEGGNPEAQTVSKKIPWTFFCDVFKKNKKQKTFKLSATKFALIYETKVGCLVQLTDVLG